MYEESYREREEKAKAKKLSMFIAKIIVLVVIFGTPFIIGFVVGRLSAPPDNGYNPDLCELEVVVCAGEEDYVPPIPNV